MSELVFERGLFATLAAALIIPELTTFVLFAFVIVSLLTLLTRQAWSVVCPAPLRRSTHYPARPHAAAPPTLHVVLADRSSPPSE
jgi:hypothetical protein